MLTARIISIGGGRIRPRGRQAPQTTAIDEVVIRATGKRRPRALFIPTASLDDADYCEAFVRQYGKTLGCRTDTLLLYRDRPGTRELRRRILDSDLVYVGGGNTLRMMKLWRHLGVDRYLNQARRRGTVLAGLSAGAICWFRFGNSDSRNYSNPDDDSLIRVRGLNFVNALCCPHYDAEPQRRPALETMMRSTPGIAVALDNCAAIEIDSDRYRIITSKRRAAAYRIYWSAGCYYKEKLGRDWQPLAGLLDKRNRL
ncbi:MAG: Type 1 glutamine amidotransferase-like domain-containing protein [Gammaproteobacteria bacterium]|nr:Type 1 glutamine amidotransferase-like domain-containing protein [Gammaproteobacteria bacterium]